MGSAVASTVQSARGAARKKNPFRLGVALLIVLLAVAGVAALMWHRWWPFEQTTVIEDLQEAADSKVQIRAFHKTYFPSPGCILEGVVFTRGTDAKPLMTIEKFIVRGSYLGILRHHLSGLQADGVHISIPAFGSSQPFHSQPSKITIGEIIANNATVDFASHKTNSQPLQFEIHQASLHDVGWGAPIQYTVSLRNPKPPGEISATGKFGPWDEGDSAKTPVSGKYKFEQADLGVFDGIGGTLSSMGEFHGTVGHIDISGTTDTPNFLVKEGGHPVALKTEFSAYVDGTHGDTYLKRVDAYFRKTHVVAQGSIARSPNGKSKTALIDLNSTNGRIEDILLFFIKHEKPPMTGAINLTAKVTIPPGQERFLKKVKLQGRFAISRGEFSRFETQQGVNKLSTGARGEKVPADDGDTALTDLGGEVVLEQGVAHFSELVFHTPGATARMIGTYNIIDHRIALPGQMKVDSKISNTTTGAKAFLLKVMDPFFKKRKKGEVVPIRISGTYEKPSFGLDLNDKKNKRIIQHLSGSKASSAPNSP